MDELVSSSGSNGGILGLGSMGGRSAALGSLSYAFINKGLSRKEKIFMYPFSNIKHLILKNSIPAMSAP